MATGKRYYWIKLKESFMTSDAVDFMMSQRDGANYVVLYQMLCLKTINTDGRLSRQIGEVIIPYDIEKIRRDTKWFTIDTVRIALDLYKKFGLIYEDIDGTLVLAKHSELVGSETDAAERMRNSRAARNALPAPNATKGVTADEHCANNVTPDIRYKSLDIRDQENKNTKVYSAEPDTGSAPMAPPVISLPLIDGTMFDVSQDEVTKYATLYPAVDVMQELREMVGWLDANQNRRKTRKGVKRFINNWLSREQDRGGTLRRQTRYPQPSPAHQADTRPPVQGNPFADYLEDNP